MDFRHNVVYYKTCIFVLTISILHYLYLNNVFLVNMIILFDEIDEILNM